jgi:hypothetical protein
MAINEPQAKRRGRLKNGNPAGDPSTAPRCGARTRKGTPCNGPALHNGRCRMHGGTSAGPRTAIGLARSRRAHWKHGRYSAKAKREAKLLHQLLRECREQCREMAVSCQSRTRNSDE